GLRTGAGGWRGAGRVEPARRARGGRRGAARRRPRRRHRRCHRQGRDARGRHARAAHGGRRDVRRAHGRLYGRAGGTRAARGGSEWRRRRTARARRDSRSARVPPRPGVVGRSRRAAGRAAALLVRRRRTQRRHRPRGRAQAVGDGVAAGCRLRAGVVPAWPVGRAGGGRRARADRAARARARARRAALLIPPPMRPDRLLAMLCLTTGLQTFSIGAFPALLPELGRGAALADWQLGAVAGAFGLARMLADLPAGLLMTHHVRRALIGGPAVVLAGMAWLVPVGAFGRRVPGRSV